MSKIPADLDYALIPRDCTCGLCAAEGIGPPDCRYRSYLQGIIRRLQRNSLAPRMRGIGSFFTDKPRPGDIDVVIDLDNPIWQGSIGHPTGDQSVMDPSVSHALSVVLAISRAAYGALDPFYRWNGQLYVRNDHAMGWIRARHARSIYKAARDSGVEILEFVPPPQGFQAAQNSR